MHNITPALAERHGFKVMDPPLTEEYDYLKDTLSPLQLRVLANRVNNDSVNKKELLSLMYNELYLYNDLDKLKDVYVAGKMISDHIKENKHILVVSDYDSDGINSAIVLSKSILDVLNHKESKFSCFVNTRRDGNGFNKKLLDRIVDLHNKHGIDLVITSDHGSSDNKAFGYLKEKGIVNIICTDHHHVPEEEYPINASIFVNNQRTDSQYSKDVSGCCIAFLTMLAAFKEHYGKEAIHEFNHIIPYVAISTITDVMSMKLPYNRHIVKTGLNELNSFRNKAWLPIKNVMGIMGKVSYKDLGFKLGPLINTANRLDCEELGYKMLMSKTAEEAFKYSSQLSDQNDYRKAVTKELSKQVLKELKEYPYDYTAVALLNTDVAINGVVAAKIGMALGRPTVCFLTNNRNTEVYPGSCRGILQGVNVLDALDYVNSLDNEIFVEYGGHDGAAGCKIKADKLDLFKQYFDDAMKLQLDKAPTTDEIYVDAIVKDTDLNPGLATVLEVCGPYGKNWPEPVLLTNFKISHIVNLGSIAKVFLLTSKGEMYEGMHFFNTVSQHTAENIKDMLKKDDEVIVAYNLNMSSYNNIHSLSMTIVDIKKIEG